MSEKNKQLCAGCDACCQYVAIEIDKPTGKNDYHNVIWYLLHENVNVFVDFDNNWHVEFVTPCLSLDKKTKLCRTYDERPKICRGYDQSECVKHDEDDDAKFYFKSADDFKKYLQNKKIDYKFNFKK